MVEQESIISQNERKKLLEQNFQIESQSKMKSSINHPDRCEDYVIENKHKKIFGVFDGVGGSAAGAICSRISGKEKEESTKEPEKKEILKDPELKNVINFINSKDVVDIKDSRKLEKETDRYKKWNAQLKLESTNEGPYPVLMDNKPILTRLYQGPLWIWKSEKLKKLYVFAYPRTTMSIGNVSLDNTFTLEDGSHIRIYAAGEYIEIIEPAICEEVREGKEWLLKKKGVIKIHQDEEFRNKFSYDPNMLKIQDNKDDKDNKDKNDNSYKEENKVKNKIETLPSKENLLNEIDKIIDKAEAIKNDLENKKEKETKTIETMETFEYFILHLKGEHYNISHKKKKTDVDFSSAPQEKRKIFLRIYNKIKEYFKL